ncbi:MAG: alpha/beta hydrolase [bacterium]
MSENINKIMKIINKKYLCSIPIIIIILTAALNPVYGSPLPFETSNFIEINGHTLHTRIFNENKTETIVMLHGFGASTYSFNSIIDSLDNYRILLYDRPGFGFSGRPLDITWENNPYDYSYQAGLLKSILDYYDIDKAHIAGHSAGGFIALIFTAKYPCYTDKIILINPSFTGRRINPLLRKTGRWSIFKPLIIDKVSDIAENGERIIEKSWFDKDKLSEDIIEAYKAPLNEPHWQEGLYYLMLGNMPQWDTGDLRNIEKDVLVITAQYDSIIEPSKVIEYAGYLPNHKLIVFDSCGHIPHEEIPGKFVNTLLEFVE